MRELGALLLRAVGVSLLLATVLFPMADHHALERLSDPANARPEDAHWLLVHHHAHLASRPAASWATTHGLSSGPPATTRAGRPAGAPSVAVTLLPEVASPDGAIASPPVAVVAAVAVLVLALGWRLRPRRGRPPPSVFRPVPVPPPRPRLLLAA